SMVDHLRDVLAQFFDGCLDAGESLRIGTRSVDRRIDNDGLAPSDTGTALQHDFSPLEDRGHFSRLQPCNAALAIPLGAGKDRGRHRPAVPVAIAAGDTTLVQDAWDQEAAEKPT